jgi:hypothetical protein
MPAAPNPEVGGDTLQSISIPRRKDKIPAAGCEPAGKCISDR